ncbi:hypothetical protein NUK34_14025 [Kerstersia gyiorum]|uniref:hypothetical protein n=1 Tax=Kerstersia gyiorum TaxID=206506 RepID=UPI002150300C|nr:hypothetical protein [Kerstersia gyiorum]MCR4159969.1 hypothetical protein [Kerstersia gyiorum]
MIPKSVMDEIVSRAKESWPNNKEMQRYCISEEVEGYSKLASIDFGDLIHLKEDFIESAKGVFDGWDSIYESVESELSAYREISAYSVEGVSSETIDEWREQAREQYEGYYSGELEFLNSKKRKHLSVIETRTQIDPIKSLLVELEAIIGNECYNGNIQNYSSWGELESEGRNFRYPVKFYTGSGEKKLWKVTPELPSEELITGYYAFGANELNIYRALFKMVAFLREKYGLQV